MCSLKVMLSALSSVLLFGSLAAAQPTFTEISPLTDPLWVTDANSDFWINSVAAADVDGDGDLDIAVIGFYVVYNESVEDRLVLFLNEGRGPDGRWVFSHRDVPLNGLTAGASDLAWGDFNGDGHPDLAVGSDGATVIYRNDGGILVPLPNALPPYFEDSSYTNAYDLRSLTWADADNDGDLDLLIPSVLEPGSFQYRTRLLRNDGPDDAGGWIFTEQPAGLDATSHAQTAWADDDGDGDLDLFMLNIDNFEPEGFLRRYENVGAGTFQGQDLLGIKVNYGVADWGDYDGDGDMDILVAGNIQETDGTFDTVLRIYRNDGGGVYVPITLPAPEPGWLDFHAASWGDYDSDGVMDLLVTGSFVGDGEIVGRSEIYVNREGTFVPLGARLPAPVESVGRGGAFTWLDIDGDGDLDYLVAGAYYVPGGNGLVDAQIHLYRNDASTTNAPPSAPSGLTGADMGNGNVLLSWNPAVDDKTGAKALTYELEVAPSAGIAGETALPALGHRLPEPGNISAAKNWRLRNLPAGTYDWSVRAVDSAFNGGQRAAGSFTVTRPPQPAVAIARPKPGSTVKGVVTIRVAARDDQDAAGKLRVVVAAGGQALPATYEPATQLYKAVWNTTGLADGSYTLRGFAVDAQGNRGASMRMVVTVDNVP